MSDKDKPLTAAEIAARRPQAAKVMKRKDGSTYTLGTVYGRKAPETSPKPKTRPEAKKAAPKKAAAKAAPKKNPMATEPIVESKVLSVVGFARPNTRSKNATKATADGNTGTGTGTVRTVKGLDGKSITKGRTKAFTFKNP